VKVAWRNLQATFAASPGIVNHSAVVSTYAYAEFDVTDDPVMDGWARIFLVERKIGASSFSVTGSSNPPSAISRYRADRDTLRISRRIAHKCPATKKSHESTPAQRKEVLELAFNAPAGQATCWGSDRRRSIPNSVCPPSVVGEAKGSGQVLAM